MIEKALVISVGIVVISLVFPLFSSFVGLVLAVVNIPFVIFAPNLETLDVVYGIRFFTFISFFLLLVYFLLFKN